MNVTDFKHGQSQEVITLFRDVFTAADGEEEGGLVSQLVAKLVSDAALQDVSGFVAIDEACIKACLFFSRLRVPSGQKAVLLSPVAVATGVQGTGVGQGLINYSLSQQKSQGVALVFTYGDPAFYSKTGFSPLDEDTVPAPYPLSQPAGWLVQSLDGDPVAAMHGLTECVPAFRNPALW